MAKYFMGGTKYESYERMMMSHNRNPKFYEMSVDFRDPLWYVFVLPKQRRW